MLAALACTFSLGEENPDPSVERTKEAAHLQQTVAAQVTLMAGSPAPADEPDAQEQNAPQPAEPCLVAFHSKREGEKTKIYIFNTAGGVTSRLSPAGDWDDHHASWSPDGTRLAYVSDRDGDDEIYVINRDGGMDIRMTYHFEDDYWPAWSPDGGSIAYVSERDGKTRIVVAPLDGSGERVLNPEGNWNASHPSWSPDSASLAFSSNRDGDWDVFLMDANGSRVTQVVNQEGNDWYPAWSPDGRWIAYGSKRGGSYDIFALSLEGGPERQLTSLPGDEWVPAWTPDGGMVAFNLESGASENIYAMSAAGGIPGLLISSPAQDRSAAFSPACNAAAVQAALVQAPIPQEPAGEEAAAAAPAAPEEPERLIRKVSWDRTVFHCVKGDGPTTLTFTADMSDVDRGLAIFWRLYEKGSGRMTDWQNVSMTRKGSSERTYTFNADGFGGVNNFTYPPLYGESWFQFQFVSGDAQERTQVYRSEVTFFPCAQ